MRYNRYWSILSANIGHEVTLYIDGTKVGKGIMDLDEPDWFSVNVNRVITILFYHGNITDFSINIHETAIYLTTTNNRAEQELSIYKEE